MPLTCGARKKSVVPQPAEEAQRMMCVRCDEYHSASARFCPHCGVQVAQGASAAARTPAQAAKQQEPQDRASFQALPSSCETAPNTDRSQKGAQKKKERRTQLLKKQSQTKEEHQQHHRSQQQERALLNQHFRRRNEFIPRVFEELALTLPQGRAALPKQLIIVTDPQQL